MGGSGIVINADSRMLTNHHVIAKTYDMNVLEIPVTIANDPMHRSAGHQYPR